MESLDLTYSLVDLKIKSRAPIEIYFMSQLTYNLVLVILDT